MIKRTCRRPTLIDLMIVIAFTAVGFAGVRAESGDHYHSSMIYLLLERGKPIYSLLNASGNRPAWYQTVNQTAREAEKVTPVLAAWTIAFLVIRLRRPRLPLGKLFRQPGTVAGASVAMTLGITTSLGLIQLVLAQLGITWMTDSRFSMNLSFLACRTLRVEIIGMIVVLSWCMLAVSRTWRREPGWIDWLGIALGIGWIIDLANQIVLLSLV